MSRFVQCYGYRRYDDGREVCDKTAAGKREYQARIELMAMRDDYICCICMTRIVEFEIPTFEHKDKRGMGGARRDDRIDKNGVAHMWCNMKQGSVRTK